MPANQLAKMGSPRFRWAKLFLPPRTPGRLHLFSELAVEQTGPRTLNDPGHSAGTYKPNDGISETGRLVVLYMPVI
jgi:hypothetical protein